ncbi:MAG: 23S rRNA (adenine(2503)-C(2))-methyltransferase RlmN [Vampirovibrionales bacterium]|nr:23S rRNA (adenine(2503)-C(2))-methyltransferase RlmN [Vampirovibrionales bacterium]
MMKPDSPKRQPEAQHEIRPEPSYLIGHDLTSLQALMQSMEEPAFRAEQLHQWLYVKCVRDYEAMSNLAKSTRAKLAEKFPQIGCLTLHTREQSRDGTQKFLFELASPANLPGPATGAASPANASPYRIESVLMPYQERGTLSACISSQAGCAVGCHFCATAKLGFKRQLTVAEIVDQYLYVQHLAQAEVRNIVFMGQGEPLLNLDNVIPAMMLLNQSAEVGMRRMTISTAGIVPGIYRLAQEALPVTLAVSLHAPDDTTRSAFMPINAKYPIAELLPALHHYVNTTRRRLTIEYIMLAGINDSPTQAHMLAQQLKGLKCNVNLIPYNPIAAQLLPPGGEALKRSSPKAIETFREIVSGYGRKVTVRLERGADINAACGQLANQHSSNVA